MRGDFKGTVIKIDELQKLKNGKLSIHWTSTKHSDWSSEPNPSFLSLYLANDQPSKLEINYRFLRNRPVCEPVQLLAKVCHISNVEILLIV